MNITPEELRKELEKAYQSGWDASGEGFNAEYMSDRPETKARWNQWRDEAVTKQLTDVVARHD